MATFLSGICMALICQLLVRVTVFHSRLKESVSDWSILHMRIFRHQNQITAKSSFWETEYVELFDASLQENICWWNVGGCSLWTSPSGDISQDLRWTMFSPALKSFQWFLSVSFPNIQHHFLKNTQTDSSDPACDYYRYGENHLSSASCLLQLHLEPWHLLILPEECAWSLGWACLLWLYSPSVKSL